MKMRRGPGRACRASAARAEDAEEVRKVERRVRRGLLSSCGIVSLRGNKARRHEENDVGERPQGS